MLKKFFSNLISSFMGAWLALVLMGVVAVILIVGLISKVGISSQDTVSVSKGTVLVLNLSGEIIEAPTSKELDYKSVINGNIDRPQTLQSILTALEDGAANKNIKGLYIKCGGVSAAPATLNALRTAVVEFKKNKPVYAYADSYTTGDYYVASVADSVFVNPAGEMALKGLSGGTPYMKGLFDKLGVNFQVVKVGTFKSAVEPYIMESMSEPARAQLDTLYGNMWLFMRRQIAESRKGLTPEQLQILVNDRMIGYAPLGVAKKANLYDRAIYRREMTSVLARLSGRKEEDLNLVSTSDMISSSAIYESASSKNQIAVLFATGEISDTGTDGIVGDMMVKEIVKLADNDNVKGLVLRVNSPGGSAFASEQIGEALDYFRSCGKPLTVSMGDYAASGGYWISCCADRIFADNLTITGSIGIFGLIPNVKKLTNELGVNMQWVSTTPDANFPNLFEPLNEQQLATMQEYVERGYDTFVKRVAKGRNMKEGAVRRIAEGRVWDAMTAKKIGLVDELGGLKKAVEWTAQKAEIAGNYNLVAYPRPENSIWDFLPSAGMDAAVAKIKENIGPGFDDALIKKGLNVIRRKPVQALMPEIIFI